MSLALPIGVHDCYLEGADFLGSDATRQRGRAHGKLNLWQRPMCFLHHTLLRWSAVTRFRHNRQLGGRRVPTQVSFSGTRDAAHTLPRLRACSNSAQARSSARRDVGSGRVKRRRMKLSYAMRRSPILKHSSTPVGINLRLAGGR